MATKTSLILVTLAAALVGTAAQAGTPIKGHGRGFTAVDANSGEVLFDDGKLDGKGCAVGLKAVFDKDTQTFKQVPAVKCNFQ